MLHRYSFADGDATAVDSVGGQDGTLENGAVISGNAVQLDGSNQYVNLPSDLITDISSLTFEVWFSRSANGTWARVFDFGDINSNNGRYYIFYTPQTSSGTSMLAIADADPGYNHDETINYSQPILSVPVYIACVYDGDQNMMSLYVDGEYASSISVSIPLSSVDNVYSFLGRSLYSADPYLNGSIDEFRIYNHALSSEDISTNYNLGPDVANALHNAALPQPANNSISVPAGAQLSWTAPLATPDSYTVYVSDNSDFIDAQVIAVTDANSCDPDLNAETTYYWRVDTNYGSTTYAGYVWNFTTCALAVSDTPTGDMDGDYEVGMADLLLIAESWLNNADLLAYAELSENWLTKEPALIINEFMADNDELFADPDASVEEYDDWIEIYNQSSIQQNLGGMYLTDDFDNPDKWMIPEGVTVDAYDYIVFWADGQEEQGIHHTNFQLNAAGDQIGLYESDAATLVDSVFFDEQPENLSYGRFPDNASEWNYFAQATPGYCNCKGYDGAVAQLQFSHERGFYDTPFSLAIICDTSGAQIYYTTDGSAPIEDEMPAATSIAYTAPINLSSNACIRAAAIKTDWLPTNVDTHTYIFDATEIIKSLPVCSIVGDPDKTFWGPNGILLNATQRGILWERPVSFEILDPETDDNIQIDCGIRVAGSDYHRPRYTLGDDWDSIEWYDGGAGNNHANYNYNKFSFKLFFRDDLYGEKELNYPLFPLALTDKFKSFQLRAGHNDSHNPFVKDELLRRLHKDMGGVAVIGTMVSFYLNGEYKSFYNPCERLDHDFFRSYYDVDTDWDVITQRDVRNGDATAWNATLNYVRNTNLSDAANYAQVGDMIDIVDFIDYLIVQLYSANWDWPSNNWTVSRERTPEGKFRFHLWDMELTMETDRDLNNFGFDDFPRWGPGGLNGLETPLGWIYRALKVNPEFRLLFADRIQKHFYYDGALTQVHIAQRFNELRQDISMELPDIDTTTLTSWIPNRHQIMLDKFTDEDLFDSQGPDFKVNGISQHGGYVSSSDTITITETGPAGTIYYTLNGEDPRISAADSQTNTELTLVLENTSKKVLVPTEPVTDNGAILAEYWFGISGTSVSDLTNNGNYPDNPSSKAFLNSFEIPTDWAENYGSRVRGYLTAPASGDYKFWIASDDNSQLWLSTDDDPANVSQIAYVSDWTNSREWTKFPEQESANISLTAGQTYYIEALQKEGGYGDNLAVSWEGPGFSQDVIDGAFLSPFGESWMRINFDDTSWGSGIGGVGYERSSGYESYIDIDTEADMYNTNASCYIRIPFTISANDLDVISSLKLNMRYDDGFIVYLNGIEVVRVNFTGSPQWDSTASGDHEASSATDSFELSAYVANLRVGDNLLAIHGLNRSTDSSDFLITAELTASASNAGSIAPTAIEYTGGFQFGQSTELKSRVLLPSGEWSALHEAPYGVGPVAENLRITEIMYHPVDPNDEFIELQNIGSETIDPALVSFTNGIDFNFPSVSLAPGDYILVASNPTHLALTEPNIPGTVPVLGSYMGRLEDAGEKIELMDAAGQIIHHFSYKDGWYDITDGEGFSLTIMNPTATDPNLWDQKIGWRPSAAPGGSPGFDDAGLVPAPGSIVINEVLAHSHALNPDWIELHNTTGQLINIGGWFLSDSNADDPNITKYQIPVGTSIDPNGYYVFYEDTSFGNPNADGVNIPFALSEGGDSVYLRSGIGSVASGYEESESFGASATGIAFGRYIKSVLDGGVNFVPMSENTPDGANAYPQVGPVVISEIMYNTEAVNTGGEYLELHNITGSPVTLEDEVSTETSPGIFTTETVQWQFSDGIDFVFPANTTIPANGYLIIVEDPTAFTNYYGTMPSGVDVLGPFANGTSLSNGGERVQIVRPGDQEYGNQRFWIRTERVTYDDEYPWPVSADGDGDALHQKTPDTAGANYGNDVINWQASTPNPGQ